MTIYQKLLEVQAALKVPKSQYNSFGKYKYRSCEDILEAVKPLLREAGLFMSTGYEVKKDEDWHYVEATVTIIDIETGEVFKNKASAREDERKKGMDGSQITGTASSYANKYCLNGLFLIDDTKDADTDEYSRQTQNKPAEGEHVRFPDGKNCEVLAANGKWYNVETLPTDNLLRIVDKPEFTKAHSAITAVINNREVKQ